MFHTCGTLLITKKDNDGYYTICPRCNERVELNDKIHIMKIKEKTKTVVLQSAELEGPTINFICPNKECDSIKAIEMVKPPMFGDEEDLIM